MKNGNDEFSKIVNQCEGMAHWYEERDPALAEHLYKLIQYTKALDKNQKALIKRLVQGLRYEKMLEAMLIYASKFLNEFEINSITNYGEELNHVETDAT